MSSCRIVRSCLRLSLDDPFRQCCLRSVATQDADGLGCTRHSRVEQIAMAVRVVQFNVGQNNDLVLHALEGMNRRERRRITGLPRRSQLMTVLTKPGCRTELIGPEGQDC